MSRQRWLGLVFYVNLLVLAIVVGYKLYLDVAVREAESVHAEQVETIQERLASRESFRFAVVGNINNSIGLFERQIVPMLNASGVDFVVSAGNAVSDGGADKYRALEGTLDRLEMPYLIAFGENEADGFGDVRYYRRFGPHFFAFTAGETRFIFLDSTGETSHVWQLQWLEDELAAATGARATFVITGRPIEPPEEEPFLAEEEDYLGPPAFRHGLLDLLDRHRVDAVFAGQLPMFDYQVHGETHHVTTGGAGGLIVGDETSFHHFVTVSVSGDQVSIHAEPLDVGQHPVFRTLESLWMVAHSFFFVGYLNFLLVVSLLVVAAVKLHGLLFVDRDYYPSFELDPAPFLEAPLRVAMFTNNFLPFIGGVPISIDRLRRGLEGEGHEVLVVAPSYGTEASSHQEEAGVLRVPTLLSFAKDGAFRLANIFLPRIWREVRAFKPDVVHLHHPFWLGSLGLWLARRMDVPAIYSYHTRLEHYGHYVPVPGRIFRNLISHYMVRRFADKCAGVVVPTLSAREYLRAIGVKSRIAVQPTGVELATFRDVDPALVEKSRRRLGIGDEPVLLSVSRLGEEKNLDFMLDGIAELTRVVEVPFRFLLVGEGEERGPLEARIEEEGLGDVVLMPGSVSADRMPAFYRLGDIFVFASTTETQGMVVLEAMAAGLPVVAVRSSGIDDLVRDGIDGYKTREDRAEWTARIRELLTDEARRADLASNARASASEHGVDRFARRIVEFYAASLAARGARERRAGSSPADATRSS